MADWWNESYVYRRPLKVGSPEEESLPVGHPVEVFLGDTLQTHGKTRHDYDDIEVVRHSGDGISYSIARNIEEDESGDIAVVFALEEEIPSADSSSEYYIYYGNPYLEDTLERPIKEISAWPVVLPHYHNLISYTRPGQHWVDGRSAHYRARATVQVHCVNLRILSELGPENGTIEIRVDDEEEWREVSLYAPLPETRTVFEIHDLDPSRRHEFNIRVGDGLDPKSLGNTVNIERIEYTKSVDVDVVNEEVIDVSWSSSVGGM